MPAYEFKIKVAARYLQEQSDPDRSQFVFAYTVNIRNVGSVAAQLISRHWVISSGNHTNQEVQGLGVVGQQPLLQPGEEFEYTSGATLSSPLGSMHGEYFCVAEDGTRFEAQIPEFVLSLPRTLH